MNVGITLLIILAIPTLFQLALLSSRQKQRHEELIVRMKSLEEKIGI